MAGLCERQTIIDQLPDGFLKLSKCAWQCPAVNSKSHCQGILGKFKVRPDERRGLGWGNPFSRVWFVGINPHCNPDNPSDRDRWAIRTSREWSKEDAISNYAPGEDGFNYGHFNYHRDIMDLVAEKMCWPDRTLSHRIYHIDTVLCGSKKAEDVSEEIRNYCSGHYLIPLIRLMRPRIVVAVGKPAFRSVWEGLGEGKEELRRSLRDLAYRPKAVNVGGTTICVVGAPQPRGTWWRDGEKKETIKTIANSIATALAADN